MSENQTILNQALPQEDSLAKEIPKPGDLASKSGHEIEEMILEKFKGDELQTRIQAKLRGIITNELSKMSGLMRESIRDWIKQEKDKSRDELDNHKKSLVNDKLLESDKRQKELESKIETLERKIQLKDKENSLILQSLKQLMGSQNKK